MPSITSVTSRVSELLRYLQPSGRCRQNPQQTGKPQDGARGPEQRKPVGPCLLGSIQGAARRSRLFQRQSQSMPPERRRPSRGRSRSPEVSPRRCSHHETESDAGDAMVPGNSTHSQHASSSSALSSEQRVNEHRLFGCFCRENMQRQALQIGGAIEAVSDECAHFSVRLQRVVSLADLLPKCFTLLSSDQRDREVGPGVVAVMAVREPYRCKEAQRQLAQLMHTSASLAAGILLVALEAGYTVERLHLQHSLATSDGMVSKVVVATTEFNADLWNKRVATLRGRGRSSDPGDQDRVGESRGRTLSRGSRERRGHAPARRALSMPEVYQFDAATPLEPEERRSSCGIKHV